MVDLLETVRHIHPFRALVIGDFMLDSYTTGKVKRISPEAPVPVLEVIKQESRPGGAGNVALSLKALGAEVLVVGRVGKDPEGSFIEQTLSQEHIVLDALLEDPHTRTPLKNRLIAESQQLLRIDQEMFRPISVELEQKVLHYLTQTLPTVQVVAISDYAKGFLTTSLLASIMSLAKAAEVPVIVDPKGIDVTKYRGATVLKPNLSEAYAAARMNAEEPLEKVARQLIRLAAVEQLLITRSEAGMTLFDRNRSRKDFPSRLREVKDVTGAGDTVLAVISAALANDIQLDVAAQCANIAAGIAVERLGCVQVTLSELSKRVRELSEEICC